MAITPKKCCVRYDPPALVLFYELQSTRKLHRRSIPLRDIDFDDTNENVILENLLKENHHAKYIREFNVDQLKRLMKHLIEKNSGLDIVLDSEDQHNGMPVHSIDVEKTDLNKLGDEELNVLKNEMDIVFEKNQVKPNDPEWKYDHEVDFKVNSGKIESSGWDEEDDSDMEF